MTNEMLSAVKTYLMKIKMPSERKTSVILFIPTITSPVIRFRVSIQQRHLQTKLNRIQIHPPECFSLFVISETYKPNQANAI